MSMRRVITTVTTAANSFKLTTVNNIRADLAFTDTSVTDDYLDRLNAQCSRSAANACGREFALQNYRDTFKSQLTYPSQYPLMYSVGQPDADQVTLTRTPVVAVTAVTEGGISLVANVDYELDLAHGFVYRLDGNGNRAAWSCGVLIFDYQAGWTLPEQTLPAGGANALVDFASDLEADIIKMVKAKLLARDRDPNLRSDEVSGVGRQEYVMPDNAETGDLSPDILAKYSDPTIA